ncbi:MAG: serine hydrolase [bacterium]|nr:serine hydrolase [bacterium]
MDFFKKQKTEEFRAGDFRPRELSVNRRQGAKEQESQKVKGDNRFVFGLLLGTIFLSVGFWLWGNLSRNELGLAGSTKIIILPTPTPTPIPRKTEEISDKIFALTNSLKGNYGVYVYNLTAKHSYALLGDQEFTAASLIKLPVILTLYQEVEKGKMSLDDKYTLRQADKRSGAGGLQYRPVGTVYTFRQLAEVMGQQSDNTAFAAMSYILGEAKIQSVIDNLGMAKTSFTRNETTPNDMGLFWRKLYGGSVVTREHREEILSFLTKTAYEDRIPAGVPEGTRVAHKIGNETGVFSDAGIVFADKPFILVILSKNALEREAKTALPEITKAVWGFETSP